MYPFPERGAAGVRTALSNTSGYKANIIANKLDEQQLHDLSVDKSAFIRSRNLAPIRAKQESIFRPLSINDRLRQVAR